MACLCAPTMRPVGSSNGGAHAQHVNNELLLGGAARLKPLAEKQRGDDLQHARDDVGTRGREI